jgi:alpha-L-fucosidase
MLGVLALSLALMQPEPTPTETLRTNTYPKWFTEGKLGIWAHWGPQSVPMMGDWYARNLYIQGQGQYEDHLKRYGHPSKTGYKDLIPLWKAENWDPDRLMGLYKAAGAKYFVSMGCHHDNFDLWNSKFHRWNAVNMGPKKDVVGIWQKAAKKLGLHFGVSEHMGASFTWFQVSRGADKTGPMAGVPYDGNDPAYEDLYHAKTFEGDNAWYTKNPVFQHEWAQRITDLIDNYHPDLLYSDGGLPFGEIGEQVVAHYYNQSRAAHGGNQEVVYTCKQPSEGRWAQDLERGVQGKIQPYPWQTDTSIGDWFYNKNWKYRHADWVIKTLVDVVSKNGNLLINVVQRPDGSLDPEAEQVLTDMAAWMKVNSESIYGTTPWITYGEGTTHARGGSFSEDFGFTEQDVRYAAKGDHRLYATFMGQLTPGEKVLKMVRKTGQADVTKVRLLGGKLTGWSFEPDGLHVVIPPGDYSSIATVLEIDGSKLRSIELPQPEVFVNRPNENGAFDLKADQAEPIGASIHVETRDGQPNLGFWDDPHDGADWLIDVPTAADFRVSASVATPNPATAIRVSLDNESTDVQIATTGDWGAFKPFRGGVLHLAAGRHHLKVHPANADAWHPINLRWIHLEPQVHAN